MYVNEQLEYPDVPPYHPDVRYPELTSIFSAAFPTDPGNRVYGAVRSLFFLLGLDRENYGTERWNPLSGIIRPGQNVLIKPNFVMHESGTGSDRHAMHTHGSVLRVLSDYALLAMRGQGELVVADSPLQGADFERIVSETALQEIMAWYLDNHIAHFTYYDLRKEYARLSDTGGMTLERVALPGDPKGYRLIDVGKKSALEPITDSNSRFGITGYRDPACEDNHRPGVHRYLVSGTVLEADVVLNLPKLKTHMKTGMTGCLKNMVGINGSKDYLPHHRKGSVAEGGDEVPRKTVANQLFKLVREYLNERAPLWLWKTVRFSGLHFRNLYSRIFDRSRRNSYGIPNSMIYGGSWYGNDTTWRMVHDLNYVLVFADKNGVIRNNRQRRSFSLMDAVVAGEGEGPLSPTAKTCGIFLAGEDPLMLDAVAAYAMGFDPMRIPMLYRRDNSENPRFSFFDLAKDPLTVISEREETGDWYRYLYRFSPPQGWKHHIEKHDSDR